MKKHIYSVASRLLLSTGAAIAQSKVRDGSITGTSSLPNIRHGRY
ncbi:MAG: hypothetical protein WC716_16375 [Chitinophagaceae bacterium]|jgi:hypothetical protein